MSTQAPGPDGHRPDDGEGRNHGYPADGTTPQPGYPGAFKDRDGYTRAPGTQGGYPQGPGTQGGYPSAPHSQNPYAAGPYGQVQSPGPYGQPYAMQKSRVVAGILGILLGAFGVHRFYLGYTTVGVIQVLMSTVLAFLTLGLSAVAAGIWGLVEGIMILVGSQQFQCDAHGVPLRD